MNRAALSYAAGEIGAAPRRTITRDEARRIAVNVAKLPYLRPLPPTFVPVDGSAGFAMRRSVNATGECEAVVDIARSYAVSHSTISKLAGFEVA